MPSSDLGALLEALRDKRADRCQAALSLVELAVREDLPRGVSVASVCKLTLDEAARACAEASKHVGQGTSKPSSQDASSSSSSKGNDCNETNDSSAASLWLSSGLAEIKQIHRLGYLVCRVLSLIVPDTPDGTSSRTASTTDSDQDHVSTSGLQSIELSVVTGQNILSFMVNCGALLDVALTLEDDAAAASAAATSSAKSDSAVGADSEDVDAAFEPLALVRALRRVFAVGLLQPSLETLLDLVVLMHELNTVANSTAPRSSTGRLLENNFSAARALGPFSSLLLPVLLNECIAACGRTSNARRTFERVCSPAPLRALLAIYRDGTGTAESSTNASDFVASSAVELVGQRGSSDSAGVRGAVEQLLRAALLPGELLPGLQALAALHFKEQQRAAKKSDPALLASGKAAAAAAEESAGKKKQKRPIKGQSADGLLAEHADSYQWRLVTVLKDFMTRGDTSVDELLDSSSSAVDSVGLGSQGACLIIDLFADASFEAGRMRADLASAGGALGISASSSAAADSSTAAASSAAAAASAAAAVVNPLKRRRVTAAGEEAAAARATFELFSALATATVAASGLSHLVQSTSNAQGALAATASAAAMEEEAPLLAFSKSASAASGASAEVVSSARNAPDSAQLGAWATGLECLGGMLRAVQRAGAYRLHEDSQGSHLAMLAHCADVALAAAHTALDGVLSVNATSLQPSPLTEKKQKRSSTGSGTKMQPPQGKEDTSELLHEAAIAVVIAAFRSCGALLELSHLSFEGRLPQLLRLALLAHHHASSSVFAQPSGNTSTSSGTGGKNADPEATLLARGAFDSPSGFSFGSGHQLFRTDLRVVACSLLCRLARSFGALRQLPPLLAAFLSAAQGAGPAVAGTARHLLAQPQSPLRRAFAAAASRAPSGQLAEGTRVVSEAVAAALLSNNNNVMSNEEDENSSSIGASSMAVDRKAQSSSMTSGQSGNAFNEVCNLALDVARVWLQNWPVRSPASAAVGSAAVAKAAAAPLVEPLQRVVTALMTTRTSGSKLVAGKSKALSSKATTVSSTDAAAAAASVAASEGMQDWRLAASLRWYSLILQAAQSCEAWLARGVDEPPTPPLLIQHYGGAPPADVPAHASKNGMDLDKKHDMTPEQEKEEEEEKSAAKVMGKVVVATTAVTSGSGWDEGQLLGSLLAALLSAEVPRSYETPSFAGTAATVGIGGAVGAVALAVGELALVRLHQLHASLGALPLFEDRAAAEQQGAAWQQEAIQLLDFLLLDGGNGGLASDPKSSNIDGGGSGADSTATPSSSRKKSKQGKVAGSRSRSRLALQWSRSQVGHVRAAAGGSGSGSGGGVSSADAALLLNEAARQSPVWASLAQPKHLLALLQPLLRDAIGWPAVDQSETAHLEEKKNRAGLSGLAGLLADASFWEVAGLQAWLPHAALLLAVDLFTAATTTIGAHEHALALLHAAAAAAAPDGPPVPGSLIDAALAAALDQTTTVSNAGNNPMGSSSSGSSKSSSGNQGHQEELQIFSALGRLGALLAAAPLQDTAPHALPALIAAALAVSVACGHSSDAPEAAAGAAAAATWMSGAASWTAHLAADSIIFCDSTSSSRSSSNLDLFAGTTPGRAAAWVQMLCRRASSTSSVILPETLVHEEEGLSLSGLQQSNSDSGATVAAEAAAGWLHSFLLFLLRAARQSSKTNSSSSTMKTDSSSSSLQKSGRKIKALSEAFTTAVSSTAADAAAARAREALEAVEAEIRAILEGSHKDNNSGAELPPVGKNPKSATKRTKTGSRALAAGSAAAAASGAVRPPKWVDAWNPCASLPVCAALRAIADAFTPSNSSSHGSVLGETSPPSAADNDGNDAYAASRAESAGLTTAAQGDDDDDDELAAAVAASSSGVKTNPLVVASGGRPTVDFNEVWHASGAAQLATVAVGWADTAADAAAEAAEAANAAGTVEYAAASKGTSGADTTVVAAATSDAWSCYAAQVNAVDAVLRVVSLPTLHGQGGSKNNGGDGSDDDEWSSSLRAAVAQASSLALRPLVDLASAGLLLHLGNGAASTTEVPAMTRAATAAASLAHTLSSRALSDRETSTLLQALVSSRGGSIETCNPLGDGNSSSGETTEEITPCTESVTTSAAAAEAVQVQRAALQSLVRGGASTDQRRSLLARLASDLESALSREPLAKNNRRGGSYDSTATGSAAPLLPCLKLLVLTLGACCSGVATKSSELGGSTIEESVVASSSHPLDAQAFHPGALVLDALLESACMAVDQHAAALASRARSKSMGRSKWSLEPAAAAATSEAPAAAAAAGEVAHARSVAESAECVALGMECLRLLLGVKGLLHAKHWHVARALGAAASAARAVEAVSSGLCQWGGQNRRDVTTSSAAAPSAASMPERTAESMGVTKAHSALVEAQAAAWATATEAVAWAMERAVTCVSRLLRTHGKLVYAAASLLAQLHSACFHAVAQLVEDAFVLTSRPSSVSSVYSATPPANARICLSLLKRLGGRSARALARLLADTSADAHQLSLKKHLPPLLLDAMAGLELPGWASLASSAEGGGGGGDATSSSSFGKRDLQPGILACLAALGPREVQLVSSLLPGGRDGAPRALFKQLLEDYTKRHKYRGQH